MEAAHDTALQERPEAINALRMDGTVNVLFLRMLNESMWERAAQVPVA
jgi:hypothetical protein